MKTWSTLLFIQVCDLTAAKVLLRNKPIVSSMFIFVFSDRQGPRWRILNSMTDIMKIRSYVTYIFTWTKLLCQDFQMCSTLNQNTHTQKSMIQGIDAIYAYMRKNIQGNKVAWKKVKWDDKKTEITLANTLEERNTRRMETRGVADWSGTHVSGKQFRWFGGNQRLWRILPCRFQGRHRRFSFLETFQISSDREKYCTWPSYQCPIIFSSSECSYKTVIFSLMYCFTDSKPCSTCYNRSSNIN